MMATFIPADVRWLYASDLLILLLLIFAGWGVALGQPGLRSLSWAFLLAFFASLNYTLYHPLLALCDSAILLICGVPVFYGESASCYGRTEFIIEKWTVVAGAIACALLAQWLPRAIRRVLPRDSFSPCAYRVSLKEVLLGITWCALVLGYVNNRTSGMIHLYQGVVMGVTYIAIAFAVSDLQHVAVVSRAFVAGLLVHTLFREHVTLPVVHIVLVIGEIMRATGVPKWETTFTHLDEVHIEWIASVTTGLVSGWIAYRSLFWSRPIKEVGPSSVRA